MPLSMADLKQLSLAYNELYEAQGNPEKQENAIRYAVAVMNPVLIKHARANRLHIKDDPKPN